MENSDRNPKPDRTYIHFVVAICAGMIISALGLVVLEYFGIINYVKNWP